MPHPPGPATQRASNRGTAVIAAIAAHILPTGRWSRLGLAKNDATSGLTLSPHGRLSRVCACVRLLVAGRVPTGLGAIKHANSGSRGARRRVGRLRIVRF
jgi:hypothetical protein